MIHHVAFVESLRQFESEGAETQWRETWAGLLVLRLYRLWQLDPEIARTGAAGAESVRAVVDGLPESGSVKQRLTRILDTLRAPAAVNPTVISQLLGDYAAGLGQAANGSLARDVYRTAGLALTRGDCPP